MNTKLTYTALVLALVAVLGAGYLFLNPVTVPLGSSSGTTHTQQEDFLAGVSLGGQSSPTNLGFYQCATATVNPTAFQVTTTGSGMVTTSAPIAITGATSGDSCSASLTSATDTSVKVSCSVVSATGSTTLQIWNLAPNGSTLDLGSGTAKVCAYGPAR